MNNDLQTALLHLRYRVAELTAERISQHVSALPPYVAVFINDQCNYRCRMCFKWTGNPVPLEVDVRHWERFFSDLRCLLPGEVTINVTGGEPLLTVEVFDIIRIASSFGFSVQMPTNGSLLTSAAIKKLVASGLKHLTVSLDGMTAQTHDKIRGVPGSHADVLAAIRRVRSESSISVNTCSVIMRDNLAEILPLAEWLAGNDDVSCFIFQAVAKPFQAVARPSESTSTSKQVKVADDWYERGPHAKLWPTDQELLRNTLSGLADLCSSTPKLMNTPLQFSVFEKYFRNYREFVRKIPCNIDEAAINVNESGDVFFCLYHGSLGNIAQAPLSEILGGATVATHRTSIKNCKQNCQSLVNCNFKDLAW